MALIARFREWLASHEPVLSWGAFLSGVVWDALTLQRIDQKATQDVLLALWLGAAGCALLIAALPERNTLLQRVRLGAAVAAQFALGGLLSALSIFYLRSASWGVSVLFVATITALLVANEFLRARYLKLVPLFGMWSIATAALALLVVPTFWGEVAPRVAAGALLLAAGVACAFGMLLARLQKMSAWSMGAIACGVPIVLWGLYSANLIPPVPLVAREVGIYHYLWRDEQGYHLVRYKQGWGAWLWGTAHDATLALADNPIYCYSAVFAPEGVGATVFYHWQYRDKEGSWHTHARIPLTIVGGREGGFRSYTFVRARTEGEWRCVVEDAQGRTLGKARTTVQREPIRAQEEVVLR